MTLDELIRIWRSNKPPNQNGQINVVGVRINGVGYPAIVKYDYVRSQYFMLFVKDVQIISNGVVRYQLHQINFQNHELAVMIRQWVQEQFGISEVHGIFPEAPQRTSLPQSLFPTIVDFPLKLRGEE